MENIVTYYLVVSTKEKLVVVVVIIFFLSQMLLPILFLIISNPIKNIFIDKAFHSHYYFINIIPGRRIAGLKDIHYFVKRLFTEPLRSASSYLRNQK